MARQNLAPTPWMFLALFVSTLCPCSWAWEYGVLDELASGCRAGVVKVVSVDKVPDPGNSFGQITVEVTDPISRVQMGERVSLATSQAPGATEQNLIEGACDVLACVRPLGRLDAISLYFRVPGEEYTTLVGSFRDFVGILKKGNIESSGEEVATFFLRNFTSASERLRDEVIYDLTNLSSRVGRVAIKYLCRHRPEALTGLVEMLSPARRLKVMIGASNACKHNITPELLRFLATVDDPQRARSEEEVRDSDDTLQYIENRAQLSRDYVDGDRLSAYIEQAAGNSIAGLKILARMGDKRAVTLAIKRFQKQGSALELLCVLDRIQGPETIRALMSLHPGRRKGKTRQEDRDIESSREFIEAGLKRYGGNSSEVVKFLKEKGAGK